MYYKKILAAALTVSCIGGIVPANSVQAASLKIRYSGKTRYYKGKQLHVSYANRTCLLNMLAFRSIKSI